MGTSFFWTNRRNWEKAEKQIDNITILSKSIIYSIMSEIKAELHISIKDSANFFGVARASYYLWINTDISNREKQNLILLDKIKKIRKTKNIKAYGISRITDYINEQIDDINFKVNHKRIERICKQYFLNSKFRHRKKIRNTISIEQQFRENIINRNFNATRAFEKIFGDITQINTNMGTLYLCAFIDVYNNKILATNQKENIVLDGIKNIIDNYQIEPYSLIVHTDRGSVYTGKNFRKIIDSSKIIHSMSRAGHCADNAPIERFWGIFKDETFRLEKLEFSSLIEAKNYILDYIHFYNNDRISKK